MFEKLKKFMTNKKTNPDQPIVVLNEMDKLYLAAMRRDDAQFAYVLALVANRQNNTRFYDLVPHTEVYTFETKTQADAYYGTVQQIARIQQNGTMKNIFDLMSEEIIKFYNKSR